MTCKGSLERTTSDCITAVMLGRTVSQIYSVQSHSQYKAQVVLADAIHSVDHNAQ